jgi:uncharacterized protein (TIGR00255 family)
MIKSMTGYGRASDIQDGLSVNIEIKSVNSRSIDLSTKLYRTYSFLEENINGHIRSRIARGKVDCFVNIEKITGDSVSISINEGYTDSYIEALKLLADKYGLENDVKVSTLAQNSDLFIINKTEDDEEAIWNVIRPVLDSALDAFIISRETEGEKLKADLIEKLEAIEIQVGRTESLSTLCAVERREKLESRIRTLLADVQIDENRLLTEVAIIADKVSIDEEIVRLRSHLIEFRNQLDSDEPVGRNLDFRTQEINREANTIGSKAQNIEIANAVIAIKGEVEKIREQVQNIE